MFVKKAGKDWKSFVYIFVIAQLSIWHGGISDFISEGLLSAWNKVQMFSIFVLIFTYIAKRKVPSYFTICILLIRLWLAFVTYINNQPIDTVDLFRYSALVLLIDLYKDEIGKCIEPFMLIFEFMVYYNLYICIQTGPDIYGAFYGSIGYDNDFTIYFIVANFWSYLYFKVKRNWIRPLILVGTIHFTLLYTWVITGLFALIISDILLIVNMFCKLHISLFKTYMIYIVAEIMIVFIKIQNLFQFFITSILKKDMTFSGRTNDWDNAINIIISNPFSFIFGHGNLSQEAEKAILGDVYCHNSFLEQFFRGGFVYWILFLLMIFMISKRVKYSKDIYSCNQQLIICICALWVAGITESLFERYIVCVPMCALYAAAYSKLTHKMNSNRQYKLYS